jgi:hypothetical protein
MLWLKHTVDSDGVRLAAVLVARPSTQSSSTGLVWLSICALCWFCWGGPQYAAQLVHTAEVVAFCNKGELLRYWMLCDRVFASALADQHPPPVCNSTSPLLTTSIGLRRSCCISMCLT